MDLRRISLMMSCKTAQNDFQGKFVSVFSANGKCVRRKFVRHNLFGIFQVI